jgi:hypothetical protein
MGILLGVVALFAIVSLIVAVMQAVRLVRHAPKSEQLGSFLPLGWFKFSQIESKINSSSELVFLAYKRAVIAFLVLAVIGLVLSGWMANQAKSQTVAVNAVSSSILSDLRRVAHVPGVHPLES